MREIKYRQALMSLGKFCGWHYWGFIDGKFVSPAESSECSVANAEKHSYQFIGKKDKNNQLIYLGDIVKIPLYGIGIIKFGDEENAGGGDNSAVFYGYYYESIKIDYNNRPHIQSYELDKDLEVIGNIIENHELLESAK